MSAQSDRVLALLGLPASAGPLLASFHCALLEAPLPCQGTLHCLPHHLGFLSALLPLQPVKLVVPLRDVRQVRREKALGLPTGLSVHTDDRILRFAALLRRERAARLIEQRVEAEARNQGEDDDDADDLSAGHERRRTADTAGARAGEGAEDDKDDREGEEEELNARGNAGEGHGAGKRERAPRTTREVAARKQRARRDEGTQAAAAAAAASAAPLSRDARGRAAQAAHARLSPTDRSRPDAQRASSERRARTKGREEEEGEEEEAEEEVDGEDGAVSNGDDADDGRRVERSTSASSEKRSPGFRPPPPHTLYEAHTYTAADPLVTAIAERFSSLTSPLDTRNRRYLHDGPVQRQGRFSVVRRHMFLFSDQLILAKAKDTAGRALQMKRQMALDGLRLDVRPLHLQRKECMDTRLPLPFRVLFTVKGRQAAVVLSAEDATQRRVWVRRIQLAASRVLWAHAHEEHRALEWGWYMRLVQGSVHLAVLDNAEAELRQSLQSEPSLVDERDQEGLTPLMVAAHVNRANVLALLLTHPCHVELRDSDGRTALHIAAKLGYAESVAALLQDDRVHPRIFHPRGGLLSTTSALWMAALAHRGEYETVLKALVAHCRSHRWPSSAPCALLDGRDSDGSTLMELCTALSLTDVLPILVSLGATLDLASPTKHRTPLCLAARQTDMDSLITLIQLGAQPNWRDPVSGAGVVHFAASLEVASFLVAHGARMAMKTREGQRITDVYAEDSQLQTLQQAEALYLSRRPVETSEPRKPRPRTLAANGGHALDSCAVCSDGVGGLGGVMKKIGWCARCGLIMCSACLRQSLIFAARDGGGGGEEEEEVAPACSGCFNLEMYRAETADKKARRVERQRKQTEDARRSLFTESGINLAYLTDALTAVHISQKALPDGRTLAGHQMLGRMQLQEDVQAAAAAPAPPALRRASTSSTAPSPPPGSLQRGKSIGPGSGAPLAGREERTVNYASGGALTPTAARRASQLALNNLPVLEADASPSRGRKPATLNSSASMDGVSDRHSKRQRPAMAAAPATAAADADDWADVHVRDDDEDGEGEQYGTLGVADARRSPHSAKPRAGRKAVVAASRKAGSRAARVSEEKEVAEHEDRHGAREADEDDEAGIQRRAVGVGRKVSKPVLPLHASDSDERISTPRRLMKPAANRAVVKRAAQREDRVDST